MPTEKEILIALFAGMLGGVVSSGLTWVASGEVYSNPLLALACSTYMAYGMLNRCRDKGGIAVLLRYAVLWPLITRGQST